MSAEIEINEARQGLSSDDFEARAGKLFHPDATALCVTFRAQFSEALDTQAVKIANEEQADSVSSVHVREAFDYLTPRQRRAAIQKRRQVWSAVSGFVAALAVSWAVGFLVEVIRVEGAAPAWALWGWGISTALSFVFLPIMVLTATRD